MNFTQADIPRTNQKLTLLKAHGGGTIAAAAALVKHEISVLLPQLVNYGSGLVS
jgi:hypothetical protein